MYKTVLILILLFCNYYGYSQNNSEHDSLLSFGKKSDGINLFNNFHITSWSSKENLIISGANGKSQLDSFTSQNFKLYKNFNNKLQIYQGLNIGASPTALDNKGGIYGNGARVVGFASTIIGAKINVSKGLNFILQGNYNITSEVSQNTSGIVNSIKDGKYSNSASIKTGFEYNF